MIRTILLFFIALCLLSQKRQEIHAVYIPLADHYAALVAHYKYKDQMTKAKFTLKVMENWPTLRKNFTEKKSDLAFILSPLAMDMFHTNKTFQWVSLMHRDGSALAVNDEFNDLMDLHPFRYKRGSGKQFATAVSTWKSKTGTASISAVPSLLSSHAVVLYKYLKRFGKTLSFEGGDGDVIAKVIAPPKSPLFLKNESNRGVAASFVQALPWADIVETNGFGYVAMYSKDVVIWPNGHIDCIAIAQNEAIQEKRDALKEVIYYIHKAGQDIDEARKKGGKALTEIAEIIHNNYIKSHSVKAIEHSLDERLAVINYSNLNNDLGGIKQIMDLAVEAGLLQQKINIDLFSDSTFSTKITRNKSQK